jgi:hypothetical protein
MNVAQSYENWMNERGEREPSEEVELDNEWLAFVRSVESSDEVPQNFRSWARELLREGVSENRLNADYPQSRYDGMFPGESVAEAARSWQGWCEYRSMTGLALFLGKVAALADGVAIPRPAQPLTDEEIDKVLGAAYRKLVLDTGYSGGMGSETWDRAAARAIAAHVSGVAASDDARDAARYRWLRDRSANQWEHPIAVTQRRATDRMQYIGPLTGENLDEAIDAARGVKEVGRG